MTDLQIFGEHEDRVVEQLERCAAEGDAPYAVLCADGHLGYSMPVGGVVAYPGHVSPSGVGYDIGCGNKAVRTNILAQDIAEYGAARIHRPGRPFAWLADEINRRISFGVGRANDDPVDHPVLDEIKTAAFAPQRQLYDLAAKQLGTVGAGNHYVDLFKDEEGVVWIGVHFGSRGFGHKTASGFLSLANGGKFEGRATDGEMDAPPTLIEFDTDLGLSYVEAMELAGRYAYAGRDVVVDRVCDILGANIEFGVHNHHNFAWSETHGDQDLWVVRKGATPAFPGQRGFVGASMGEPAVILEGVESDRSAAALYSTVHGAGRAMSRTKAAGKFAKNAYACMDRDCDRTFLIEGISSHNGPPKRGVCPDHPEARVKRVRGRVRTGGAVDWQLALRRMREKGIELRGGAADEAPLAYKRLPDVLAHHAGTVRVLHTLDPLVVVMAGAGTHDPYKD